jgi:hypothetical protein
MQHGCSFPELSSGFPLSKRTVAPDLRSGSTDARNYSL